MIDQIGGMSRGLHYELGKVDDYDSLKIVITDEEFMQNADRLTLLLLTPPLSRLMLEAMW
ncbi:hypothetical protein D3C76_1816660 [compost metagenome]